MPTSPSSCGKARAAPRPASTAAATRSPAASGFSGPRIHRATGRADHRRHPAAGVWRTRRLRHPVRDGPALSAAGQPGRFFAGKPAPSATRRSSGCGLPGRYSAAHRLKRTPAATPRSQGWLLHRDGGLRMSLSQSESDQPGPATESDVESVWRDLHDPLLRFIAARVPDRATAEDILQEVMLRLHRHADQLRHVDSVSGWIHTIARNTITDYYRAAARRELPVGHPIERRRARRAGRGSGTEAAAGGADRLSGAAAGPAVPGAPGGAAAHRPARTDPGRGGGPARVCRRRV